MQKAMLWEEISHYNLAPIYKRYIFVTFGTFKIYHWEICQGASEESEWDFVDTKCSESEDKDTILPEEYKYKLLQDKRQPGNYVVILRFFKRSTWERKNGIAKVVDFIFHKTDCGCYH